MRRLIRIGFTLELGLTVIVLGAASLIGVPEKWFGSLFLLCVAVGSIILGELLIRESDRQKL